MRKFLKSLLMLAIVLAACILLNPTQALAADACIDGHTEVTIPGKTATCFRTGLTEGKQCSVCGEILVAQEIIPVFHDDTVIIPGRPATCTEEGLSDGEGCNSCGELIAEQEILPALGHTVVVTPGKAPTTTETGLTESKTCSVCGKILVAQEVLPVIPTQTTVGYLTFKVNSDKSSYYVSACATNATGTLVVPATVCNAPVTGVAASAFKNCTGLSNVTIPDSVTSIGSAAFSGCSGLQSMTIPFVGNAEDATSASQRLFGYIFGASSYTGGVATKQYNGDYYTYYIPASLKTVTVTGGNIRSSAFDQCSNLQSITLPESITSIGNNAFRDCSSLQSITIPETVVTIGSHAFYGCDSLTTVNVPDSVTSIGNYAFNSCDKLTTVTMGTGVTTIESYAFSYCSNLTGVYIKDMTAWLKISFSSYSSNPLCYAKNLYLNGELVTDVVVPESITAISQCAFYGCVNLNSIIIPDSVTSIGSAAFSGCSNLQALTIPFVGNAEDATNYSQRLFGYIFGESSYTGGVATKQYNGDYYTYYIPASLKTVTVTGGNIRSSAFDQCSNLQSITLPESITSIGNNAFRDCSSLQSITIPETVVTIGSHAFYGCDSLTTVNVPDSVTSIGNYAFNSCDKLTTVTMGTGVTTIESYAFSACSNLTGVYIKDMTAWLKISFAYATSNPLYYAKNLYLNGELVTELVIPESVTTIGTYTFRNCSMESLVIPDTVTTIESKAFNDCKGLKNITIGKGVTAIPSGLFYGCSNVESITIPYVGGSRKTAGDTYQYPLGYIFGTSSYTGAVKTAQYYYGSSTSSTTSEYYYIPASLKSVTVTDSDILYGAFYNCTNLTDITLQDAVTAIGKRAFYNCTGLSDITISNSVSVISEQAFYNCDSLTDLKDLPTSIITIEASAYENCDGLVNVTMPESIITIGASAFYDCRNLEIIAIPNGVTMIGGSAFYNCTALQNITIPETVTILGSSAFRNCDSLTEVTIPGGMPMIGTYAFYDCDGLVDVTILHGVTTIGDHAFFGCNKLKTITIPSSITNIDDYVFDSDQALADVYYAGTADSWKAVSIGSNNNYLKNAALHYVSHCDAYGHTRVTLPAVNASCVTDGLTEGEGCAYCDEIFVQQQTIPAVGQHSYDNLFDAVCNACGDTRETSGAFQFVNYRVVFSDSDETHKNWRVEVYKLGDKTVVDPADEKALKAIDANPATYWGIRDINKILLTDAGNYVLLLKYNVGTNAATKIPMVISVSADPKLIIDKNNKITVIDNNEVNINHRVVVYYLGDQTVEDIYDVAALEAIDAEPETIWKIKYINRLALTKGGNYVLHLCYNEGVSAKMTVAQQFTVYSIPSLSVDNNNMLVVTEENLENRNHRVTVYYLGEGVVEDPFDEAEVKAAAYSAKTYWGLPAINKAEILKGGNYVIHLYYNVGTSEKRTLALDLTLNERPALSVDANGKITVSYTDPEINNPRAYIYNVGDAEIADIYDEAALKSIATPTQVWGLSSVNKKTLTPGTYVVHFCYSVGTSAKKTVALKITI